MTTEEVVTGVKKLKAGKAAGTQNIPAELFKNAPQKLYKMIVQLFTICINKHTIHKEWIIVHITPIFKHGDRKNCDNYPAISITSTFSRLFGRTVRDLIENENSDKELEEQAGFRAGRSHNDNIQTSDRKNFVVLHNSHALKCPPYLTFHVSHAF